MRRSKDYVTLIMLQPFKLHYETLIIYKKIKENAIFTRQRPPEQTRPPRRLQAEGCHPEVEEDEAEGEEELEAVEGRGRQRWVLCGT